MKTHLVLGGPGCGKTTRLLDIVAEEMNAGVPPDRIAFVAFTRAAAHEARRRAAERFNLDPERDLPWFRTIHSLVYTQLGLTRDELMSPREWAEFAALLGYPPTYAPDEDTVTDGIVPGYDADNFSKMLRLIDYAAATQASLEDVWHWLNEQIPWLVLKQCDLALTQYKQDVGRFDFSDILRIYTQGEGSPVPVQVAIIDEAQDLTPAQWAVVDRAFAGVERRYVGGDDDQAIYTWAGASIDRFMHLNPDSSEVLPVSYRLAPRIHRLAQKQVSAIRERYAKPFRAREGEEGTVEWHNSVELPESMDRDSWFLLARNGYFLRRLIAVTRVAGYPYMIRNESSIKPKEMAAIALWRDIPTGRPWSAEQVRVIYEALGDEAPQLRELAKYVPAVLLGEKCIRPWQMVFDIPYARREYYERCLERAAPEELLRQPRLRIDTMHGVKGLEADHVFLMTDMSRRTYEGMDLWPDAEHRVWYVGLTRARHSLQIVAPQSDMSYAI